MEILDHLAVALGFATLAGVNLYLTTFVTGLAFRLGWVPVFEAAYPDLALVSEWPILIISGVMLLIEVSLDKVPWVDSLWDALHTAVRPIGGALLAVGALGESQPEALALAGLVGAGASAISHSFKSGTRLMVNNSPEPFSNVAISTSEDFIVAGGLAMLAINPRLTGVACLIFLVFALFTLPRLYRRLRGFYWLLGQNVFGKARKSLSDELTLSEDMKLREAVSEPEVKWSVRVVAGKAKGLSKIRPWMIGKLIAVGEGEPKLYFVSYRWRRPFCVPLESGSLRIEHRHGFFSEHILIKDREGTFQAVFRIPRRQGELAGQVLRGFKALSAPPEPEPMLALPAKV